MNIDDSEIKVMKRGMGWVDLEKSLIEKGCPVCNSAERAVAKYFDFMLFEYANDVSTHKKMLASMGMCAVHSGMLKTAEAKLKSDGLNIAVLYETVIQREEKLLADIEKIADGNNKDSKFYFGKKGAFNSFKQNILKHIVSKGKCPGCENQNGAESFQIHNLLKIWPDEQFRKLYENNDVLLCRNHFLYLIKECANKEAYSYYLEVQKDKIARLHKLVNAFIAKHAADVKENPTAAEKDAWHKILEYTGSKPDIHPPGRDFFIE